MLTIFAGLLSAHLWTERAVFAQKLVFPYQKKWYRRIICRLVENLHVSNESIR